MREILFRGKRIDNGEWMYGFYFCMHHDDDREHLHHFIIPLNVPLPKDKPIGEIQVEVDPTTIGQYTGLTANGKKIFEGDIVDITQYDNVHHKAYRCCRAKVFFSNFAFRTNAAPEYEDEEPLSYWFWHDCDFEVIGNIHDNPELLEVTP